MVWFRIPVLIAKKTAVNLLTDSELQSTVWQPCGKCVITILMWKR